MAGIDIDAFYRRAVDTWWQHSDWRRGQALMNVLHKMHPEVARAIHGTDADCFYDDARIEAFWNELGARSGGDPA